MKLLRNTSGIISQVHYVALYTNKSVAADLVDVDARLEAASVIRLADEQTASEGDEEHPKGDSHRGEDGCAICGSAE
jgi:hypothetical protein